MGLFFKIGLLLRLHHRVDAEVHMNADPEAQATRTNLAKRPPQNLSVRTTLAGTIAGIQTDDDGLLAGVSSTSMGMAISSRSRRSHRRARASPRRSRVRPGQVGGAR
jgi:ABC-type molybdate transport system ATPase subunit